MGLLPDFPTWGMHAAIPPMWGIRSSVQVDYMVGAPGGAAEMDAATAASIRFDEAVLDAIEALRLALPAGAHIEPLGQMLIYADWLMGIGVHVTHPAASSRMILPDPIALSRTAELPSALASNFDCRPDGIAYEGIRSNSATTIRLHPDPAPKQRKGATACSTS